MELPVERDEYAREIRQLDEFTRADIAHLGDMVKLCDCASCGRPLATRKMLDFIERLPVSVREEVGLPCPIRPLAQRVDGRPYCQSCLAREAFAELDYHSPKVRLSRQLSDKYQKFMAEVVNSEI